MTTMTVLGVAAAVLVCLVVVTVGAGVLEAYESLTGRRPGWRTLVVACTLAALMVYAFHRFESSVTAPVEAAMRARAARGTP